MPPINSEDSAVLTVVPMPNPAQATSGLDQLHIETFLPQTMKQIYASESATDDRRIEIKIHGPAIRVRVAVHVAIHCLFALLARCADISLEGGDHNHE